MSWAEPRKRFFCVAMNILQISTSQQISKFFLRLSVSGNCHRRRPSAIELGKFLATLAFACCNFISLHALHHSCLNIFSTIAWSIYTVWPTENNWLLYAVGMYSKRMVPFTKKLGSILKDLQVTAAPSTCFRAISYRRENSFFNLAALSR